RLRTLSRGVPRRPRAPHHQRRSADAAQRAHYHSQSRAQQDTRPASQSARRPRVFGTGAANSRRDEKPPGGPARDRDWYAFAVRRACRFAVGRAQGCSERCAEPGEHRANDAGDRCLRRKMARPRAGIRGREGAMIRLAAQMLMLIAIVAAIGWVAAWGLDLWRIPIELDADTTAAVPTRASRVIADLEQPALSTFSQSLARPLFFEGRRFPSP